MQNQTFLSLPALGKHTGLKETDFKNVSTFRAGQPIVGTYYFYWYDVNTQEHFVNADGSDALTTHPLNTKDYSYRSPAWHEREMRDIKKAGIDFILPVYWGCPSDREPGKMMHWSFEGVKALVQAQENLLKKRFSPAKIGLFYDTSTLQHNAAGYHADLRTGEGREWFYVSIRDFFSLIPPKQWAMIDGRPLIFLYAAAFAKGYDQGAIDFIYKQFESDFARKPFIVREVSWQVKTDSVYAWGAALEPKILEVGAVGPGYDHTAVPGRTPLKRDRENGDFYRRSWEQLLRMSVDKRPSIVMIETWNEWHEGTDIAPSRETGMQYLQMTARYANMFRKKTQLPER